MNEFILHENATGYALFQKKESEEVGQTAQQVQEALATYEGFSRVCALVSFLPFESAEVACEQQDAVAEGKATQLLIDWLEVNLPKSKKKATYQLGVVCPKLGESLKEKFSVFFSKSVLDLWRGCVMHFPKFVKEVEPERLLKAFVSLAHGYSRNKLKFDPKRQDKPIMNAIALVDTADKRINTLAMRVREWYSWHFPELAKIVSDNIIICKLAVLIRIRDSFDVDNRKDEITEVCGGSEEMAEEVCKAMKTSMGQDIVEMDMANIEVCATRVIALADDKPKMQSYLSRKLDIVAPNLQALIGPNVAARLITHAGGLMNLAKYPASTVQILGAEKALFRALKTKGNTPKYGLIYHSTFIGRAQQKNKGRVSRYLANKISIASRVDAFCDVSTKIYGERMREQVEERLTFLTEGIKPRKNLTVMEQALKEVEAELDAHAETCKALAEAEKNGEPMKKKKKNTNKEGAEEVAEENNAEVDGEKKKKKKRKAEEPVAEVEVVEEAPKKKKKKNKVEAEEA